MAKSYLNEWFDEFPKLTCLLNKEDRDVLSTIDPRQYASFNLTKESEVIRIINDHKPQAWKWERLFPGLKDLSIEDRLILDHIVPNEYLCEVTEQDVRRIIEYRKAEAKQKEGESEYLKATQYYQDNKKDIEKEENIRNRLTKTVKYTSLIGVSFLTASVVLKSITYGLIGAGLIALPLLSTAIKLKELDSNSLIPRSDKNKDSKMDFISAAFVLFYYIGFIGMGITLGMFPVWGHLGWDAAETVMITGLSVIGLSVMLFLILAIATPSKD